MKSSLLLLAVALLLPFSLKAEVVPSGSVSIQGAVKAPGWYEIDSPTPLSKILSQAGGLHNFWGRKIRIVRKESNVLTHTFEYDIEKAKGEDRQKLLDEVMVLPGDIVFIPEIVC